MKKSEQEALYLLAAYCSKAERCIYDLRKKMTLWELPDDVQQKIIKRLLSENFVDEKRFCRSFVKDKFTYNKWGEKKIIYELRKRKISETVYQDALSILGQEDVESQLKDLLSKKMRTLKYKDEYDRNTKLLRYVMGKGFDMGVALKVLRQLDISIDAEEDY